MSLTLSRPTRMRRTRLLMLAVAVAAAAWPLAVRLGPAAGAELAVISTIAGQGVGRTPYGLAADLAAPRTAAVDNAGMIWFTDTGHHQIKRLDPATGLVTIVAGTGMAGALGDGRPAVSASLDMPHGVAVDNRGSVYIADSANNRIRMVSLGTGLITTVAGTGRPGFRGDGGPATAAELDHPRFLVVAPDGSLIVADTGNQRIRRIDPGGVISTIAGTGRRGLSGDGGPATAADLDDPRGLALAADGTLYVAGGEGVPLPAVRRIDPTGIITTVAGGHPAGYSGDGGPATAAALNSPRSIALWGTDLYIADSDNSRIRHVDLTTGIIATVAGTGTFGFGGDNGPAGQAQVHQPRGVAVTPTGDLIIGDTLNSRLRLVRFKRRAAPPAPAAEPAPVPVEPLSAPEVEVPAPATEPPVVPESVPAMPERDGYRLVASDGGIFAFGDAGFFGSTGAMKLARPIVGMAPTPSGQGYWLVASDGGIFAFGDAGFFGSTGAINLARPIVGMTPSATGNGYRLVASDGGIFSFGDAAFFGSTGNVALAKPIVGMAATPSGDGYWLVASDGGIFSFGDATFFGSPAGRVAEPGKVVGLIPSPSGQGYRVATGDGAVFAYGDATDAGSVRDRLRLPVVAIGG
jgi:hypothetical protein